MSDPEKERELVTLAYFSTAAEAGMVCELLRNNRIDAILKGENFGALDPLPLLGGFSEIQLLVPSVEFNRAHEIYSAFFESDEEILRENEDVSGK